MLQCLTHLQTLTASSLNRNQTSLTFVAWQGRMGSTWVPEIQSAQTVGTEWVGNTPDSTSAEDTSNLVNALLDAKVDALLYAGGDGTTRDIV